MSKNKNKNPLTSKQSFELGEDRLQTRVSQYSLWWEKTKYEASSSPKHEIIQDYLQ